jgi:hypothetical protein
VSGHTKGPWTVFTPSQAGVTYGISGDDGTAVVFWGEDINDGINKIEDARLIAAAPELLEALRGYVAFAAMRRHELGELSPEMEVVDAVARAAIAKAGVQS